MNSNDAEIVRRYFAEVWGDGNLRAQEQLVAPSYTGYWLIGGMPVREGPAAHRAWLDGIRAAMPDLRYTIEDLVVGDSKAVARVRLSGTNTGPMAGRPPTGRQATIEQVFIFHIAHDQIEKEWVSFDRGSFMRQLDDS